MTETTRGPELDTGGWPILRSAQEIDCDGKNPATGRSCVLGHHNGFHRDELDAEWLDD
jgi:hypothetical protein